MEECLKITLSFYFAYWLKHLLCSQKVIRFYDSFNGQLQMYFNFVFDFFLFNKYQRKMIPNAFILLSKTHIIVLVMILIIECIIYCILQQRKSNVQLRSDYQRSMIQNIHLKSRLMHVLIINYLKRYSTCSKCIC